MFMMGYYHGGYSSNVNMQCVMTSESYSSDRDCMASSCNKHLSPHLSLFFLSHPIDTPPWKYRIRSRMCQIHRM